MGGGAQEREGSTRAPTTTVRASSFHRIYFEGRLNWVDLDRQSNLALLQNYGANAWRIHNYLLETTSKNLDKSLEELKELTTEVNRDRKNFQVRPPILLLPFRSLTFTLASDTPRQSTHQSRNAMDGAHLERAADRDGERRAGRRDRATDKEGGRACGDVKKKAGMTPFGRVLYYYYTPPPMISANTTLQKGQRKMRMTMRELRG